MLIENGADVNRKMGDDNDTPLIKVAKTGKQKRYAFFIQID